jgi:uncharacterized membrane protein
MWCVYFHAGWFGGWLLLNAGLVPFVRPWDRFAFVMLAMIASVEAIFLSTFILISQNRMQKLGDRRAELDLQVSLLSEHELTRGIHLLLDIAHKLGIDTERDPDFEDVKKDVHPEKIVEQIERIERGKES